MLNLNSARLREETAQSIEQPPHSTKKPGTTITDALKRRAQSILDDKSVDAQTRAIIRYGLEINDPDLPELIRRADNGENLFDDSGNLPETLSVTSIEEKLSTLTDLICRGGDNAAAALLVLLSTLENSRHPKVLLNAAKHLAFTRCGELNLHGMVDAQIAMLEDNLFPDSR